MSCCDLINWCCTCLVCKIVTTRTKYTITSPLSWLPGYLLHFLHYYGLAQNCSISIVNALELLQSTTKHYSYVIMSALASQINGVTIVYSTVCSDADKKHQSSALLGEFTGDRWIPRTKGQWRGKCFNLMTSSCPRYFVPLRRHRRNYYYYPHRAYRGRHGNRCSNHHHLHLFHHHQCLYSNKEKGAEISGKGIQWIERRESGKLFLCHAKDVSLTKPSLHMDIDW